MRKTLSIMAMSTLLTLGLSNNALAADSSGEKSGAFVGVHGGVSLFGMGIYMAVFHFLVWAYMWTVRY